MLSQLLLGLVNGSFYAILSLGLAVIFGLLNVINFAHGALFMMGAVTTWMAMNYLGINYWLMLVLAPLVVGIFGVVIERLLLRWIYKLDHLYGLLLTLGLTLVIEGRVPLCLRRVGPGLRHARAAARRHQPGLHDVCPTTVPGWWWRRSWSALRPGS
jgi:branched-subunit amino acid ABC-type transport system permease component